VSAEPVRLWWNNYSLADCAACGDPCVRESPAVLVRGEWAHRCCAKLLDDPEALAAVVAIGRHLIRTDQENR
jgi:hypothetical protein